MAAHSSSADEIAWMGYVGALAGLVIGLLLIISVVGIGIGVLGRTAVLSAAANAAAAAAVAAAAKEAEKAAGKSAEKTAAQNVAQSAAPNAPDTGPRDAQPQATPEATALVASGPRPAVLVGLRFPAGEVVFDSASRQALVARCKAALAAAPQAPWLLLALDDRANAARQRVAYLRLMALRNVLIEAGVPLGLIRMEMRAAQDLPSPERDLVYVTHPPAKE